MAFNNEQQQNFQASLLVVAKLCGGALPVSEEMIAADISESVNDSPLKLATFMLNPSHYYIYPDWLARSEKVRQSFCDSVDPFLPCSDIMSMINDVEDDPHTKRDLLGLSQIIDDLGCDKTKCVTTTAFQPKHLVCFGTGSGPSLRTLINQLDPYILTIVVSIGRTFTRLLLRSIGQLYGTIAWIHSVKQLFRRVSHPQWLVRCLLTLCYWITP